MVCQRGGRPYIYIYTYIHNYKYNYMYIYIYSYARRCGAGTCTPRKPAPSCPVCRFLRFQLLKVPTACFNSVYVFRCFGAFVSYLCVDLAVHCSLFTYLSKLYPAHVEVQTSRRTLNPMQTNTKSPRVQGSGSQRKKHVATK